MKICGYSEIVPWIFRELKKDCQFYVNYPERGLSTNNELESATLKPWVTEIAPKQIKFVPD